jgi:hypothetical protein
MKWTSMAVLLFSLVFFTLSMVACEKEGSTEKAGKKIDKAVETVKDKIDDATK